MNKKTKIMMIVTMGIVFNVSAAFLAMTFQIPFYMDSIGTILVAGLLGPKYAIITGVLGSFTSGVIFDVYSFYYMPVQITTGYFAGILYHTKWLKGKLMPVGSLLVGIPTSLLSAVITAFVFHGLTASSSSIVTMALHRLGMDLTLSVFLVQILTDYGDKLFAVFITSIIIKRGHLYERWGIPWKDIAK